MGQKVKESRLDNKTVRARLKPRGKPFWKRVREGLHLGYRRGLQGGVWVARFYSGNGNYKTINIGIADNFSMKPPEEILSFDGAQERLLKLAKDAAPQPASPYTVNQALDDYFARLAAEGSKSLIDAQGRAALHIRPALGDLAVESLTRDKLTTWRNAVASARPASNEDEARRHKATANRTLTIVRAALNQAFRDGRVTSDTPWRAVKGFKEVEAARIRFFSIDECKRLVNASRGAFRDLLNAALLTGARYSELCRLRVRDFHAASGTLFVEKSKSGKGRYVALTREGEEFFRQLTAGRSSDAVMLIKDGLPWGRACQSRPMAEACRNANIKAASFHACRHTYASLAIMHGVPLQVIAANLGHVDTRMCEKHYGHMTAGYIAEQIRRFSPALGTVEQTNVMPIGVASNG